MTTTKKTNPGKVLALVGAQYGSEGKGVVAAKIANRYDIHVRTGGVNAGHTFMYKGIKVVAQTVPCGWVNPNAQLVIGAGALVDLKQLNHEIGVIAELDPTIYDRLTIDTTAGIIGQWHADEEGFVNGEMHKRIGSTGKGVGAARRDRVMREPIKFKRMCDYDWPNGQYPNIKPNMFMQNTAMRLNRDVLQGKSLLLEGTQGQGLDLIHGAWPYVTSNGCGAAQMLADCGLAPTLLTDTLLVARTFPIRVAGNSGPMNRETTWEAISERVGRSTSEQTTVTKKTRRVSEWDDQLFERSVVLNGAKYAALTFADYLSPKDEGKTTFASLTDETKDFVEFLEIRFKVKVVLIGTGWDNDKQDYVMIERLRV